VAATLIQLRPLRNDTVVELWDSQVVTTVARCRTFKEATDLALELLFEIGPPDVASRGPVG
jgi:hypothetical protein